MLDARRAQFQPRRVRQRRAHKRPRRRQERCQPDEDAAPRAEQHDSGIDAERQREEERRVEQGQHEHARQRHEELNDAVNHGRAPETTASATALPAMTAVPAQPSTCSRIDRVNLPITARRLASSMIAIMIGALATPLTTALQKSALIGSMRMRLSAMPASAEIAMTR